jgi:hypothetical protein
MRYIRKALVAGTAAGIAALVVALPDGITNEEIGAVVATVVTAGLAVWRTPNAAPPSDQSDL